MDWISVEDELPKVGEYVLAYLEFDKQAVMLLNNVYEFKSPHHEHSGWTSCVTHWVPLPKAPINNKER